MSLFRCVRAEFRLAEFCALFLRCYKLTSLSAVRCALLQKVFNIAHPFINSARANAPICAETAGFVQSAHCYKKHTIYSRPSLDNALYMLYT